VDVNAAAADGTTALHWASYRDDLESAALLIRAGARVNAANDLGATPLWTASMNGSAAMVRTLLQAGADPNLALLLGETPLMAASRSGNADVTAQLLDKGAKVNARGPRGQTALMWAVSEQHPDVVTVLLAHGADLHAKSDVWRDMMAVPPHGKPEYNRMIPHGGDTALMFAARVGDLASAKLLLASGANVNDADAWGVSAMVLAAHSGFTEMVEFLLDKGADANAIGPGSARCTRQSCGATSGWSCRCSRMARIRIHRFRPGHRSVDRPRTSISRRRSWAPRPSGSPRTSTSRRSCVSS
jgi:ankyrin repeat protein